MSRFSFKNTRNLRLITIAVLAGLALLFILQNIAGVNIQFLFWSARVSLAFLILILLVTGALIGWLLHSFYRMRRSRS